MVAYKWNLTYTTAWEMRSGLIFTEVVTEVTTDLAIIACVARRFLEVQWSDYIDPLVFSSKLSRIYELQQQRRVNPLADEIQFSQYSIATKFTKVIRMPVLYIEILILLISPHPFANKIFKPQFTMRTINWHPGDYPAGSMQFETQYVHIDLYFSFMLLRFIFLIQALLVLSPIEQIHSRRLCFMKGMVTNTWFSMKMNLQTYPVWSVSLLIVSTLVFWATQLMIWEKPYYQFS